LVFYDIRNHHIDSIFSKQLGKLLKSYEFIYD